MPSWSVTVATVESPIPRLIQLFLENEIVHPQKSSQKVRKGSRKLMHLSSPGQRKITTDLRGIEQKTRTKMCEKVKKNETTRKRKTWFVSLRFFCSDFRGLNVFPGSRQPVVARDPGGNAHLAGSQGQVLEPQTFRDALLTGDELLNKHPW